MSDLRNQRRLASQVMSVGETRVWIDPLHADEVATAVTRADVRGLVEKGYISKLQAKGNSRGRARHTALQKSKGKQKGPGSREGSKGSMARDPRKERWMRTIRPLRQTLALMREEELITSELYRQHYRRAKGGVFRSRQHLLSHLVTEGVLTEQQARDVRARAEAQRAAWFGKGPDGTSATAGGATPKPPKAKSAARPKAEKPAKAKAAAKKKKSKDTEGEA
ncbi:MAG: 50S ribosomal protein L19e [Halobacteriales archaeon]|nr:50S ribosomal protein L19e [Halobacteriales archaeon]